MNGRGRREESAGALQRPIPVWPQAQGLQPLGLGRKRDRPLPWGPNMGKIKAIFIIPELRQKILLTLLFLAIYRIGYQIPMPFADQRLMFKDVGGGGPLGNILNYVSLFSGGNLS